ncbi:hypothetical protein [Persephonella sp.]
MDYRKILQVLRENVKNSFGEIFDQQLIESAVFAVEIENEVYEKESQKFYKKILLNYLDNLNSSLSLLNTEFFESKVIRKLNKISEKNINDILILPGDFDVELDKEISLITEIKNVEKEITVFLEHIREIKKLINNPPNPEPPRNKNPRGPRR